MPMYEYVCQECEHDFELLVRTGEEPECPRCEGKKLERRLSVPGAPKVSASLPVGCNPNLPPCGPGCCRM